MRLSAAVIIAFLFAIFVLPEPAAAATVGQVKAACKRTPGCSYVTLADGTIGGCSPKVCFQCPQGKNCHATPATSKGGKKIPVPVGGLMNSLN